MTLPLVLAVGGASAARAQGPTSERRTPEQGVVSGFAEDAGPPWKLKASARVLGGYDSAPAAGVVPEQRRAPSEPAPGTPPTEPPGTPDTSDATVDPAGFAKLGVRGLGEIGRTWWGRARIGLDYRQYTQGDRRSLGWLAVEGGWRSSSWATRLTLQASRYDDTLAFVDGWNLRSDAGLTRSVGDHGIVGAHIEAASWRYDGVLPRASLAGGGPYAALQRPNWRAATGADVQRRWSDLARVDRVEVVPWASAGYRWAWLDVEARYEAYIRQFDGDDPPVDGREHRLRLRAEVQPWEPPVALVAGFEYGRARGEEQALRYDRVTGFAGVSVDLDWEAEPPSALQAPSRAQGPATVTPEGVRFRVHQPEAQSVAVVGTFNDWTGARGELVRGEDGWFEGTLEVPP
ncbi:MAG: glycogen-binding domain-containing protein, partial [Myxococcota bacterium]